MSSHHYGCGCERDDAFLASDKAYSFVGRRLDRGPGHVDADGFGDHLAHDFPMRADLRRFADQRHITMGDASASVAHKLSGMRQEAVRGCALPLRVTRREVAADISSANCRQQGVGQSMEADIGIGMAGELPVMRDFDTAQDDAVTRNQLMRVIAVTDPHIGQDRLPVGLQHVFSVLEILRPGELDIAVIARDKANGKPGPFVKRRIVREFAVAFGGGAAVNIEDTVEGEGLRRLRAVKTGTRHGCDDLAVRAGRFERLGDSKGRQHATLGAFVQRLDDRIQHGGRHEWAGSVMDEHEARRIVECGKSFEAAQDGSLARCTAMDHGNILLPTRNRDFQEVFVVGVAHDHDRAIRIPAAKRVDGPGDQRNAAEQPILLRAVSWAGGPFATAGGHDHDAVALRRVHIRLYFVQVLPYGTAAFKKLYLDPALTHGSDCTTDAECLLIRQYVLVPNKQSALSMSDIAQPLQIGPVELRNRVFLAPMSGVSDLPFRQRAWRHGAGLVVSEMIASQEFCRDHRESRSRAKTDGLPVRMLQLAGREAKWMSEAARIAESEGANIIDINMGCPAKKVTGGYSGSALMRDLDHAMTLVEATVNAVSLPVTLKMRLGWDAGSINAPELAKRAEDAGVQMVTVHGRTREQLYNGRADWTRVREVREAISVPLVINGDVATLNDAKNALETSGADAVMVGRASYGQPWLPGAIAREAGFESAANSETPNDPAGYVADHYEDMLTHYGLEAGLRHARKHLGWYFDRHAVSEAAGLRRHILTSTQPDEVIRLLSDALAPAGQEAKAA